MTDTIKRPIAFVIGPIGDKDDVHGSQGRLIYEESIQVFEEIISPACNALDLDLLRADQITRTGEIPEQIFRHIRDASVVIADLTGANPNVMYELGLRHTTGKLTIQIGERGRLPFDIAAIRTIIFKRSESGFIEAKRTLVKALATGLDSGGDPVTATRVWFDQEPVWSGSDSAADLEDIEDDDLGFLEKMANTEEGIQALVLVLSTATSILEEISNILANGTAKIESLNDSAGISSMRLAIANSIAVLLEDPSSRLRIASSEYALTVKRMEPGLIYILTRFANEPEALAEAPEFPSQMKMLVDAAAESIAGALNFKSNMDNIGKAARSLRKVGKKISSDMQSLADSSAQVASWGALIEKIPQG